MVTLAEASIAFPKPKREANRALLDEIKTRDCVVCWRSAKSASVAMTPSHIATRGSHAPDTAWNVLAMCQWCHSEWHSSGPSKFFAKHPRFYHVLRRMGWVWNGRRLWHPGLTKRDQS